MCCLFGIMDYRESLDMNQKNLLLMSLAAASEARGTDATGISYNCHGKLHIYKRPLPGRSMRFHVPAEASVVMGHTRMATQGSYHRNYNNHPFPGKAGNTVFALAHNGVLYNDHFLREDLSLPKTRIETDSYVAVQLIEREKNLSLDSLKTMAEQVEGSFSFTIMDHKDTLYIVKGDSPFCLYHYSKRGLYVYCSTDKLLKRALLNAGLRLGKPERIPLTHGDILQISSKGHLKWGEFRSHEENVSWNVYGWQSSFYAPDEREAYLDALKEVAPSFGYTPEGIDRLSKLGFSPEEIEALLYER